MSSFEHILLKLHRTHLLLSNTEPDKSAETKTLSCTIAFVKSNSLPVHLEKDVFENVKIFPLEHPLDKSDDRAKVYIN